MDDDNYATVLKSFDSTLSFGVAQVNTKKVLVLDHFVLAKKWGILPKKALNIIHCTTQLGVHTVLHPSLELVNKDFFLYHDQIMCTVMHCLPLQCLEEIIGVHRFCHQLWLVMLLPNEAET